MSDRILVDVEPREVGRRDRPPRSALPLLGVAVAAAVVIGILFGEDAGPRGTGSATSLAAPPDPFVIPVGEWEPLPFGGDGGFTAVASGPAGVVAVGAGRRLDSPAFAWHSVDGVTWTEALGPWGPGDVITSVVGWGDRFVAAGYSLDLGSTDPTERAQPRVWETADGRLWRRVRSQGLPPAAGIGELAVADGRVVAIGWEGPAVLEPLAPPAPEAEGRIWRTGDARSWSDVTPEGTGVWFSDVAVGHGLVAVAGAAGEEPVLWTASGGDDWTRAEPPTAGDRAELASVVSPTSDGFIVVVRSRPDPHALPAMWRVRATGTWTRLEPTGRPMAIGWIVPLDGGLYAGAAFSRMFYPVAPELRVSETGAAWTGVEVTSGPGPWPPSIVTAATRFEDRLLAFGSWGGEAAGWVLVAPDGP